MNVSSLSRRTQLGFYGKLVFLENTLQDTLHHAIDATRAVIAGGGDHNDRFYDEVVPVPAAGMRAAKQFAKLADTGETFQSLPPADMEVTVAFTDASKMGGGFSAMRQGAVVEMEMTFDPSKLPTHHSMYTEALQMAVVLRKCCRVHRDTGRSILSNTYIIYFTDNDPLAWALSYSPLQCERAPATARPGNTGTRPVPELIHMRLVGGWYPAHRSGCRRH